MLNSSTLHFGFTIFTIPKSFRDKPTAVHQCNAIQSWQRIESQPEILLCGDDPGVAEATQRLGIGHLSGIECNTHGTPLLHDAFAKAQQVAQYSVLAYVNADIILMPDFGDYVQAVVQQYEQFLMLGRRWNLEVASAIDFDQADWPVQLSGSLRKYGIFSGIGALDYFVFPKPLFTKLPPFAVGRAGWDNWMVGEALSQSYPVVNASQAVTAIHQNHDYSHLSGHRLEAFHGVEAKQNRAFLKEHLAGNTADATCYLPPAQQKSSEPCPRISIITSNPTQVNQLATDSLNITLEFVSIDAADLQVTAWNESIMQAKGEFVLFLDENSTLFPEALEYWSDCIEAEAGSLEMCFAGWEMKRDVPAATEDWHKVEPWHQLNPLLAGREGLQGLHIWALPTIFPLLHPSSILFRRDWLVRFGSLDETLQPWAAVTDLVLRLSSRGAAAVCLEDSVLQYSPSAGAGSPPFMGSHPQLRQDCQRMLQSFFAQSQLPDWTAPLKPHAETVVQEWLNRHSAIA